MNYSKIFFALGFLLIFNFFSNTQHNTFNLPGALERNGIYRLETNGFIHYWTFKEGGVFFQTSYDKFTGTYNLKYSYYSQRNKETDKAQGATSFFKELEKLYNE